MDVHADTPTLQQAAEAACRAGLRAGLSEPEARDLAQEALVRALSSARPPEGVPLPAWVYGIARNLRRDRAKSARQREVLVEVAPDDVVPADDLATVLAVRQAVRELPKPLRDVITLHELEEHSLREAALALQIPFETAKDRLRRAREQLRERLGDADAACAHERSASRRRAARYGAAIVAGAYTALGDRGLALASATTGASGAAPRVLGGWTAAVAGAALLVGGFVAGRLSAPARTQDAAVAPARAPVAVVGAGTGSSLDPGAHVEPPARRPTSEAETALASAAPTRPSEAARSLVPAAPTRPSEAARSLATAAPMPPFETSPASASPAPSTSAPATPVVAPAPPRASSSAEAERLLLDRARAGLQRGLPDEALVTLMSHARRFPSGTLAEERDVLIIEAYLRAGNTALAQRRIERYRAEYPDGVLRGRVDAARLTAD